CERSGASSAGRNPGRGLLPPRRQHEVLHDPKVWPEGHRRLRRLAYGDAFDARLVSGRFGVLGHPWHGTAGVAEDGQSEVALTPAGTVDVADPRRHERANSLERGYAPGAVRARSRSSPVSVA